MASWGSNQNAAGAFASPLKLVLEGHRINSDGTIIDAGVNAQYWSSTISDLNARLMYFTDLNAHMGTAGRAYSFNVRCIKD